MSPADSAGSLPPAGPAPHLLVDDLASPVLSRDAWHHVSRVRRVRSGDPCTLTDGAGRWRAAIVTDQGVEATGEVIEPVRPTPPITIAFALTKGDKPEHTVQKLTEQGIDRIVPFVARNSVVRWDPAKAEAHHRRWVQIARNALEQCKGCWLPEVDPLATLGDIATLRAHRLDREGAPPSLARTVLAVGPEGGWSPAELERLGSPVSLGPQVLRAETAASTAGGIMSALRSGLVAETGANGRGQ